MTTMDDLLAPTPRAAIYLRISLDKNGDEAAVTRQRIEAHALARRRGWEVTKVYQDNSISASKAEVIRPGYEQMRADYRAGKFSVIICYDLDRLTRQPRQLEDWIDEAERHGLVLVTLNGEADLSNDNGRMFARVKAAVARGEVERKSARQKIANEHRAANGHWQFSRRPYGYKRSRGKIVVVPEEAEVVRDLYRRYVAGESLYTLANDLNERGVPTFTGPWSMARVQHLLSNSHYAGLPSRHGKRIELREGASVQWEPLIDRRTWDDYEATRKGRARAGSWSTSTRHLMSGLALCGKCGDRLLARPDRDRLMYACRGCWLSMEASEVDEFIDGLVLARLTDPRIRRDLRERQDTASIEVERADLETRRNDVLALLADGLLDRTQARERASDLTRRIDALGARLASLRAESPLTDLAAARQVKTKWDRMPVMSKRRVLTELGLEVTILPGRKGRRPAHYVPDWGRIEIAWLDLADVAA